MSYIESPSQEIINSLLEHYQSGRFLDAEKLAISVTQEFPKLIHQPKLGDIVFFPSSLHHRTVPFTTDTERIIVSFDLKPETAR